MRSILFLFLLSLAACGPEVPEGTIDVIATYEHDSTAYTQGLVYHEGALYESTGRYGSSQLRQVELETGSVLKSVQLSDEYFGEGLARVGDQLVQLTWQERTAFVYDLTTLSVVDSLDLGTHGWGLCFDGTWLYSTSGGSILFRREPETLTARGNVQATLGRTSLGRLNELECVGDYIYANVYQSTQILKIEKESGEVVAVFNAVDLIPDELRGDEDAVLNGIAFNPERGTFYLTGKLWPVLYEVRLVADE